MILAKYSGLGGKWTDRPYEEVEQLVYLSIILAGLFQIGIALFGLARLARLIPTTAKIGFLNGLAMVILQSQLDAFRYCPGQEFSVCAAAQTLEWMPLRQGRTWMVVLESFMAASILIIFPRWQKLARLVPAGLVALVLVTAFEHGINRTLIHLPVRTVDETAPVKGNFLPPRLPDVPADVSWEQIVGLAIILACVNLVESILTAEAVAGMIQMPTNSMTATHEAFAQGVGSVLAGLFSSMGGNTMIGQSTVNVLNGAHGRVSTSMAGLVLLVIILVASKPIGLVPVACLCGILFIIVAKTFYWPTFLLLFQLPWYDAANIVLVTVLAVTTNLAYAVGAGVLFEAIIHALVQGSRLTIESQLRPITNWHEKQRAEAVMAQLQKPKSQSSSEKHSSSEKASLEKNAADFDSGAMKPRDDAAAPAAAGSSTLDPSPQTSSAPASPVASAQLGTFVDEEELERALPLSTAVISTRPRHWAASALQDVGRSYTMWRLVEDGGGPRSAEDSGRPSNVLMEKIYYVHQPLFFGSAMSFRSAFLPLHDPDHVVFDFSDSEVADFTGATTLAEICQRYHHMGKTVVLTGLNLASRVQIQREPILYTLLFGGEGDGGPEPGRGEASGPGRGEASGRPAVPAPLATSVSPLMGQVPAHRAAQVPLKVYVVVGEVGQQETTV